MLVIFRGERSGNKLRVAAQSNFLCGNSLNIRYNLASEGAIVPETSREKWIVLLETIAQKRPDQVEGEWAWVMEQLGLGPEYFLAIHEAVRRGGWREADNPAGYLRTVARREARRLGASGERKPEGLRGVPGFEGWGEEVTLGRAGGTEMEGERFSSEELLDHLQYRQDSGKPMPEADGTWRAAPAWGSDVEGLLRAQKRKPRRGIVREMTAGSGALARYAEQLERIRQAEGKDERDESYIGEGPERLPDWPKWAQEAGLSEWEKKAAEYKVGNVGWTEAMAEQPDEESRRALQAAWRKLERSGEARLRKETPATEARRRQKPG